jgi:precorrin-6A/cobalt-precorrin-6A reductase
MPASPERVLILGGTGEGAALARRLAGDPRFEVVSSLAGATRRPAPLAGRVSIGGFGGAEGLADFLRAERIDRLIDATHPFAARISANAAEAAAIAGVPLLRLARPPWRALPGDRWIEVADAAAAAARLPGLARRAFLSLGRKELAAFAKLEETWFLVRLIEAPASPLPLMHYELVLGRGPFAVAAEVALLRTHGVEALVTKNSGGDATYAKIVAARRLALPVLILSRPPEPEGVAGVGDIGAVLAWLGADGPMERSMQKP